MYVDRETCKVCQNSLLSIRKHLKLGKLTVINKNGKKFEF